MRVIYNGIDLCVIETYAFDCESVYDDSGMNYLYTRVSILVRAIINGQANVSGVGRANTVGDGKAPPPGPYMSYKMVGSTGQLESDPNKIVRKDPQEAVPYEGVTVPKNTGIDRRTPSRLRSIEFTPIEPGITHQAIRHRLQTPRARLYIFTGPGMESGTPEAGEKDRPGIESLVVVESPIDNRPCDCKNGPFPKVLAVHTVLGDGNTFMVDWSCETFINEGIENGVNPTGSLLSNTFSQSHSIDEASFTTIATSGTAIFRTDLVHSLPQSPDVARPFIFIPIPQGFVRENIVVSGREDVTGVNYSFQDRQVPINFPAGQYAGAAKISAVHRQSISSMDVLGGALSAYQQVLGLKANRNFARIDQEDKNASKNFERMLARAIRRAMRPGSSAPGGTVTPPGPPAPRGG